jgi:hypothetical protein
MSVAIRERAGSTCTYVRVQDVQDDENNFPY